MSKAEAYKIMQRYISSVGGTGVEYWSDKDAEIMRECIDTLMYGEEEEQIQPQVTMFDVMCNFCCICDDKMRCTHIQSYRPNCPENVRAIIEGVRHDN